MNTHSTTPLIIIGLFCGAAANTFADVTSLTPNKDNTLYESATGTLSNGSGPSLFAGLTNFSGVRRRALVSFDVASAVPAYSTINSVTLTMHVSKSLFDDNLTTMHRVLASWGEGASVATGEGGGGAAAQAGDATWRHRFYPNQFWANAGGDFDPTVSASKLVSSIGSYTWASTDTLVADVQSWVSDPSTNNGWVLIGDEVNFATPRRYDSRESTTPSFRPTLTIDFTPPCSSDFNHDGFVDPLDYNGFINAFESGSMDADFNQDGFLDPLDYNGFINAFEAGC